jgi:hypothetical protein
MIVKVALILVLVDALATSAAAQMPRPPEPPQLTITAPPELQPVATQIGRFDAARLVNVMRLVGLADPGPPIAVVLATEDSNVGRRTPNWIGGFADGSAGVIVLFPARAPSYPSDSMEELLHHEVAHILIARAAPGALVPRWFHEGLAMAAERRWRFEDHTRLALATIRPQRSVRQLDDDFDGGPDRAARAYGVSGAFVRDLIRRHGAGLPARLLARLKAGDSFEQAFAASTGSSLSEAEAVFWRYSWWNQVVPFVTSTLAIWMGIVLLALYAMRRRTAHRAALRRRWEEEERARDALENGGNADAAAEEPWRAGL